MAVSKRIFFDISVMAGGSMVETSNEFIIYFHQKEGKKITFKLTFLLSQHECLSILTADEVTNKKKSFFPSISLSIENKLM